MIKKVLIRDIVDFLSEKGYVIKTSGLDLSKKIIGWSSINNYKENTVTWIKKQEVLDKISLKDVACIIAEENIHINIQNTIYCKGAKAAFFAIIDELLDKGVQSAGIGEGTYIGEEVIIGKDVSIGKNCTLDGKIILGDNTIIGDNVVIKNRVIIGRNTEIQPLCVIGIDGFGYYLEEETNLKKMIRHHGGVSIGENVFIGSHSNIARGTIDDTIIEDNVKIAPSTHIGHNNHIGKDTTIICSRLYGSVTVERNAYLTSCTVKNQSCIGKDAFVGMGAIVTKNISAGQVAIGIPAKCIRARNENDDK